MRTLFDSAKDGVSLRVHLQPGAGKEAVIGVHGDALKVQVVAPPVSDRANAALTALLARTFGVAPASIKITSGLHGRRKRVMLRGVDPDEFERQLELAVHEAAPERFDRRR
jgi:uncharacterized protein (TIGR00251 family)